MIFWWLFVFNRYLAAKSEADHYTRELRREQEEIVTVPETGFGLILFIYLFILDF